MASAIPLPWATFTFGNWNAPDPPYMEYEKAYGTDIGENGVTGGILTPTLGRDETEIVIDDLDGTRCILRNIKKRIRGRGIQIS